MTFEPGGPLARRQAQQARHRPGRTRWWLLAAVAIVVLLIVAGNGGRGWWARRLGDLTNGSHVADFVIGLAIGFAPPVFGGDPGAFPRRRPGVAQVPRG